MSPFDENCRAAGKGVMADSWGVADSERISSAEKTVRAKKPMKKVPGSRAPGREKRMQRRKEERQGRV